MSKRGHEFRWKPPNENGAKTPSWKDMYRQRCMDRLRENRFKQLLSKRQLDTSSDGGGASTSNQVTRQKNPAKLVQAIHAMMASEWKLIKRKDASETGIVPENIPAPSVDQMIALMEDIMDELRHEKTFQSNDDGVCEEYAHKEEEELCQAFHRMSAVEVICPICQRECLQEGPGSISCKCGLHINTEQDCVSLKNVSDNLQSGTAEHEMQCDQKPCFSQMDDFGISTLIMTCQDCDFHYIIV